MTRLAKQFFYGGIFLAVVFVILYGVYDLATPDASCSDGILNQKEEGVDCGPVCGNLCAPPLKVLSAGEAKVFAAGDGTDVLVTIDNPNTLYGATRIDWTLNLSDSTGAPKASRRGITYANPLQTRYLVVSFPGQSPAGLKAQFMYEPAKVQWAFAQSATPQAVDFSVSQEEFTLASASARYSGVVRNDSTYSFDEVDVSVELQDASGATVGVGSTVLRTVPSAGIRAFSVDWPFAVSPRPARARVHVGTNVFSNDNYIREYGAQEQFQGF